MADYEITVTRREPNPDYKPFVQKPYYSERDERQSNEIEFHLTRLMVATLTEAEYDVVKRALIQHWSEAR